MTVQAQKSTQYYNGPISVGTVLSIVDFTFIDNSHVSAKIRNNSEVWKYGTDYTVTGAGTLIRQFTVLKEVLDGEVLAVYLDVPITQTIVPEEGGKFPAAIQEFTLDKLTYICQMLQERVSRSLQISVDTDFNGTLPELLPNRTFKVNSAGTGLILSEYDPDQAIVVVEDFKNAAEAAAAAAKVSETTTAQYKAETDQIKAETDQIKAETDQIKAETEQLKQDTQVIVDQAALDISTGKTDAIQAIQAEGNIQKAELQPYADKAKDWAVKMDGKVEDIDYSAKYYAEQAAIRVGSSMLPLFYRIASDHVLSGIEAKGKLLQGSLVTNLYSDAVAHIKEDWDNGATQTFTLDDITFEYKVAQDKHFIVDITNKTQVDELFELTGIAEFYILDYANNQFYLPRNLWFDQYTNDASKVNEFNEAGLPNITGYIDRIRVRLNENFDAGGCFRGQLSIHSQDSNYGGGGARTARFDINAGSFNPIYKDNCNIVQPPSSNKLLYFIVGNTYVNQEEIDIAQVESELNNKASVNADNFSDIGKAEITGWGFPSGKYEDLTLLASGQTYTAPANGDFVFLKLLGTGTYVAGTILDKDTNVIISIYQNDRRDSTSSMGYWGFTLRAKNGDKLRLNYNLNGATHTFRFVYAEGAK